MTKRSQPKSLALSLQLETLHENSLDDNDDIALRASLCFEVFDKLMETSGPLKQSFSVVREELYHLVFSGDVTVGANGDVEKIPFADLCQTFKKERGAVWSRVKEAEEAIERKHAALRRDLLNSQAEVEFLRKKNNELVAIVKQEEATMGSAQQQLLQQQTEWNRERDDYDEQIKRLNQKIHQLQLTIAEQDDKITHLSRFESSFQRVEKVATEKFQGNPPRGVVKMSEVSMLKAIEGGSRTLLKQTLDLRSRLLEDVEKTILQDFKEYDRVDESAIGSYMCTHAKHLFTMNYIPHLEDNEKVRSLFASVEKELAHVTHDADLARTQTEFISNRDIEELKAKDQFYPQTLPSEPSSITSTLTLVPPYSIPSHVEEDAYKKMWKWINTRSIMLVNPTPRILSIDLVEVYITELCVRSVNYDVLVSTYREESQLSNVRHIHNELLDMFDYYFPYAKAATHEYRDFLFSIVSSKPKMTLVQLLSDTLTCKRDGSVLRFYAIIAKIIHELSLSTPTHLQWLLEEIFSDDEFNIDAVLLKYTASSSNMFSSKALTTFFLTHFLMENKNMFFERFCSFLEREGVSKYDPLQYDTCERALKEFYPLASSRLLESLHLQASKTIGSKQGVDSLSAAEMIDYTRLILYADLIQECIRDRVENLSQQGMLERKRDRFEQLETDIASMHLLKKRK
eukprot:m.16626 g.16626  ORF g.16626 m.16626 type:complete len:684 (-) comp4652_c0_seq1:322-2373(-)